jgi:hypothetical protein
VEGSITRTTPEYALAKINKTGESFELVTSGNDYPTELEADDLLVETYRIHYRKKNALNGKVVYGLECIL